MAGHASPDEWPALNELLGSCHVRCRRPEGAEALGRDLTGRRTALPTQHGATSAPAVPGPKAQRLQEVRTNRPWDEEDVKRQRGPKRRADATRGAGVLVVDDPGCPTPGTASAGVARQDSGTLGQGGNGQVAVPGGDPEPQASWPVAGRLSGPQPWADDAARRHQARVPPEVRV